MSLARLLNQSLTLTKRSGTATDAYGNSSTTNYGTPTAILGYLEQKKSVEHLDDRDVVTDEWEVFLPVDTAVTQYDRITYGSVTYEVDGVPWQVYNPRYKVVSHIQAKLKVVQ